MLYNINRILIVYTKQGEKMESCPVCSELLETIDDLYIHMRNKRKNISHSEYINRYVKESFSAEDPHSFLLKKKLSFSNSALNDKWKRWFTPEQRREHGNSLIGSKNSKKIWTEEEKKHVSEGLLAAYKSGRKLPPMKGKIPHNKGVPCSEEQKAKISLALRKKCQLPQP